MQEFYQERLKFLQGEHRKLEGNLKTYQRALQKRKKKIIVDIAIFLLCCLVRYLIPDEDIMAEIVFAKVITGTYIVAFIAVLLFFKDLFCLFGEYGLPTFAQLFLGGIKYSCKYLIEETEAQLIENEKEQYECERKL